MNTKKSVMMIGGGIQEIKAVKIAQSKGKYDVYHLTKPEYDYIRDYFLF